MNRSTLKISLLSLFVCVSGYASAAAPDVPTAAPYIVLTDNIDEPNGYGFCIDTYGAGLSELMQTHTCKPKTDEGSPRDHSGHDVRFEYKAETQQIESYAFEGNCMQVLIAKGKSEFALLDCSDHPHQKFVYQSDDKTFRLAEDLEKCIAVTTETVEAGPWVKRALQLVECSEADTTLKQWDVVSK
ncbi:ricin-type beta-trefoil lectin domain protein [Vibrio sp. WJH972]